MLVDNWESLYVLFKKLGQLPQQITVTAKYKTQHNNQLEEWIKARVKPLEQKLGTALQTGNSPDSSLSYSAVSQIQLA